MAAGALAAAALLVGLYFAGVNPLPTATRPTPTGVPSDAASNPTAKISSQLDNIEAELQSQPAGSTLAARIAKV
jgi:hypothetical protein